MNKEDSKKKIKNLELVFNNKEYMIGVNMVKLTFLGHSSFKIEHDSTTIYLDPWFNGPTYPAEEKNVPDNSIILVSHGHFDHFETAFDLVKENRNIKVVTNFDMMVWMNLQGIPQEKTIGMNKGGTINLSDNIQISMVPAEHSSTISYDNKLIPAGEPVGFIIKINPSTTLYYAGDTSVFSDMKLINQFYHPNIAILPIGGLFTMAGNHVAYALDNFLSSVKVVIPSHYGTFDFLSGKPEEVTKDLKRKDIDFKICESGEVIDLEKLFTSPLI